MRYANPPFHPSFLSIPIPMACRILIIISFFVMLISTASATTYYVAKTGSNSNPGTEVSPWLTISYAVGASSPVTTGDTIVVKNGTYNERVVFSKQGSAGNYLTLRSQIQWGAVIDGTGVTIPAYGGLVQAYQKSYINISGMKVQNSNRAGILFYGQHSNSTIHNNYVNYTSTSCARIEGGGASSRTYDVKIINNVFERCESVFATGQEHETVDIMGGVDRFEVAYNLIHDSRVEQIDMKQNIYNGNVHHNTIYGGTYGSAYGTQIIYIDARGTASNISIYNNRLYDKLKDNSGICTNGIGIASETSGTVSDINVYNNIIHNVTGDGIGILWYSIGTMKNISIVHNTIANLGTCTQYNTVAGIEIDYGGADNISVKNNIIDNPKTYSIRNSAGTNKNITNNLINGFKNYGATDTRGNNYFEGNPGFINNQTYNFDLNSTALAIDNGAVLPNIISDFGDRARPQAAGYDIGAYEYSAEGSPPTTATVLKMNFNEGSGNVTVDSSGYENNGTIFGAQRVSTPWGSGIQFQNSWISVPNSVSLQFNGSNAYTVRGWINLTVPPANQTYDWNHWIAKATGGSNRVFDAYIDKSNSKGYGGTTVAGTHYYVNSSSMNANQWYRWIQTYNETTGLLNLYLNGTLINSTSYSFTIPEYDAPIIIGAFTATSAYSIQAIVDEVQIDNYAISDADALSDYNSFLPIQSGTSVRFGSGGKAWSGNSTLDNLHLSWNNTLRIGTKYIPIADTYIRDGTNANTNYGTSTTIEIKNDSTSLNRIALYQLNITQSNSIRSQLFSYVVSLGSMAWNSTLNFSDVNNNSWTETGITWNTAPAPSGTRYSEVQSATASTWIGWNITRIISSNDVHSIRLQSLTTHTSGLWTLNSKESSNIPYFAIWNNSNGSVTVSWDVGTDYKIFRTNVNATLTENYIIEYRQNGTESYTQLGGLHSGNTSEVFPTNYSSVDVRVTEIGNLTGTTSTELFDISLDWQTYSDPIYTPSIPLNLSNTTNNFYTVHSWEKNPSGNITDVFNVQVNGTWYNSTPELSYTNYLNPHGWTNLTVCPVNQSGSGTVGQCGSQNTQLPNNNPEQFNIGDQTVIVGSYLNFTVTTTDDDGDNITFSTNASIGSLNITSGEYSLLANNSLIGNYMIYFSSEDGYGGIDTEILSITVVDHEYIPPDPTGLSASQGNFWIEYSWSAGAGNQTDSYNVSINGTWNNGSSATSINTSLSPHGYVSIIVYAYNNTANGSLSTGYLSGSEAIDNNPISISGISDTYSLNEEETLSIDADYTDADGDVGTFSDNSSKWNVNSVTGVVSWTTTAGDNGVYPWQTTVCDGYGSCASKSFTVTVNNTGTQAPVITGWNSSISGDAKTYNPVGTGQSVIFRVISYTGNITSYNWSLDGVYIGETSNSYSTTFNRGSSNMHYIEVFGIGSDGVSNTIEWRTLVRAAASTANDTHAPLNTTPFNDMLSAMNGSSPDILKFMTAVIAPFTESMGNIFFLFIYLLPFVVIWIRQEKAIVPVGLGVILGGIFLAFLPAEWIAPMILFMVLTIVGIIYSLYKDR